MLQLHPVALAKQKRAAPIEGHVGNVGSALFWRNESGLGGWEGR
jgi:hypothetical protein